MNDRLVTFFESEIAAECVAEFPRLSVIPDTYVRRNIRFYKTLNETDQSAFVNCLALMAYATYGFVIGAPMVDHTKHPFFARWSEACLSYWGDEFFGIPILRATVSQYKMDLAKGKKSTVSYAQFQYASSIRSIKAPELRKAVKEAFKTLSCTKIDKFGGGVYIYHCTINAAPIEVWIDYGGMSAQLRYHVALPRFASLNFLNRFCFERALGFGFGDWDFITEDNLTASIQLLCQLVEYSAKLPERIQECGV